MLMKEKALGIPKNNYANAIYHWKLTYLLDE